MNPCRAVTKWITDNILVPVERFLTDAREACEEITRWVEEQVRQPVESWASRTERQCREQECNWWCLCCNKWFCWLAVVVIRVITWIVITVVKWVAYLVCKIVTVVVGIIVDLVLKVITRVVTFFVCLFTDPGQAFKNIWDLWNDIVDAVTDVFDLVISLLDDVIAILGDVGGLLDSVGRSFCVFGEAICAIFTAIFGFLSGIVDWIADVVDWVRDVVDGVRDLVAGILTLNWCRIQGALGILSVLRVITSVTKIPGGWFYSGPAGLVSKANLERIIDAALQAAFAGDSERLERSRTRARLGGSPVGLPIQITPWRMAIRSGDFLRTLVQDGVINLHAIAGRVSDCGGKFIYDQFGGEVVYTGTSTPVSQSDLDAFLAEGPQSVASFTVYPITMELYRRYLEVARRKGFEIGLNFTWRRIAEVVIASRDFIPLQSDTTSGTAHQALFTNLGRPSSNENLSEVPLVALFGYREPTLHGLTSWFRPPGAGSPSGTSFRTRFPEVAFRYVAIHEIGHYFGIDHAGHTSPKFIMWSPRAGTVDWGAAVAEFVFLSGEPVFSEEDATVTWNWITQTAQARDTLLP